MKNLCLTPKYLLSLLLGNVYDDGDDDDDDDDCGEHDGLGEDDEIMTTMITTLDVQENLYPTVVQVVFCTAVLSVVTQRSSPWLRRRLWYITFMRSRYLDYVTIEITAASETNGTRKVFNT